MSGLRSILAFVILGSVLEGIPAIVLFGPLLKPLWDLWASGDRKAAAASIPDEVVDDLIVHGSAEACRARIDRYVANGVTTTALYVLPFGVDQWEAVRALAPASY